MGRVQTLNTNRPEAASDALLAFFYSDVVKDYIQANPGWYWAS